MGGINAGGRPEEMKVRMFCRWSASKARMVPGETRWVRKLNKVPSMSKKAARIKLVCCFMVCRQSPPLRAEDDAFEEFCHCLGCPIGFAYYVFATIEAGVGEFVGLVGNDTHAENLHSAMARHDYFGHR